MKKLLFILIINLLAVLIIFISVDIFCFVKDVKFNGRLYVFDTPLTAFKYYAGTYKRIFYTKKNYDITFLKGVWGKHYREPVNLSSDKNPVLIMGCSFAFGNELTTEQSLMGKIAKYTARPVYNRSMLALGANEMLYQLRSDEFYSIIPKPEWFLYVFIPDQIRRSQVPCSIVDIGVFYDENYNIRPNLNFPTLYTFKNSKNYIYDSKYITQFLNTMKEIKNEAQKHWGDDIKYVFLFYDYENNIYQQMKPVLEQDGFTCYSIRDLTDIDLKQNEYTVSDNVHPSEKAWEIIVPELVQKTGM